MLCRLSLAVLVATFAVAAGAEEPPSDKETEGVPYADYLGYYCKRLGCRATIEQDNSLPDGRGSVFRAADLTTTPVGSVDDLVGKLRKELPGVSVVRSDAKPPVIHLIETTLRDRKDDPLDRKIDVRFKGSLGALVDRLGDAVGGIWRGPNGAGIPFTRFYDPDTCVEIDVRGRTVRQALCEAVRPLDYHPLLWEASSWRSDGGKIAATYYGPQVWYDEGWGGAEERDPEDEGTIAVSRKPDRRPVEAPRPMAG